MQHMTASSHWPAQLVVSDEMKPLYDNFLTVQDGRGNSEAFFMNHAGIEPPRLPYVVQTFALSHGIYLPNLTVHRKVIGTEASILRMGDQECPAYFMKHSGHPVQILQKP